MAMSCVFSHDQHDQRGDDGEGADEDDHRQQDEHADFSSFNAAKRLAFISIHVRTEASGPSSFWRAAATVSALYTSLTVDLDAGNLIGRQAQQIARRRKGDEPERRIVFEHAGLENARNLVGTDAGLETGGGLLSRKAKGG